MATIDQSVVRHVATLAELRLEPAEEAQLAGELDRIVAYFAELDGVDTSGVAPTMSVLPPGRSEDAWRRDEPAPCLTHDEAVRGAPRADHGGFVVPTFVE